MGRGRGRGLGEVELRIGSSAASCCVQVDCDGCMPELEESERLYAFMAVLGKCKRPLMIEVCIAKLCAGIAWYVCALASLEHMLIGWHVYACGHAHARCSSAPSSNSRQVESPFASSVHDYLLQVKRLMLLHFQVYVSMRALLGDLDVCCSIQMFI